MGACSDGFLSGFGPRVGGKTAICNLVGGGMALSTCTALDNVAESGGILNPPPPPPPNFESFLFRASCVISGLRMHSVIFLYFIILWFKLKCVRLTSALSVHSQKKGLFKCFVSTTE